MDTLQDVLDVIEPGAKILLTLRGSMKDVTGQHFTRWLALCPVLALGHTGGTRWLCRCDCGTYKLVYLGNLMNGKSKSCGCLRNETAGDRVRLPPGEAAFRRLLGHYKRDDRGHEWGLTDEQFRKLTKMPCWYCGAEPTRETKYAGTNGTYVYNGIDRVNNSKGYVPENVVPCCWRCNNMKGTMDYQQLLDWVKSVHNHMGL